MLGPVDYFTTRVNYFVRCRGCQRDIAILIERGSEDEKQPKIFSATFHTFSECQECGEKHFYDYSDMQTRQEPEPALPK
jgi:RNase P subunit RPR2